MPVIEWSGKRAEELNRRSSEQSILETVRRKEEREKEKSVCEREKEREINLFFFLYSYCFVPTWLATFQRFVEASS